MNLRRMAVACLWLLPMFAFSGCGSGDGTTVIQPGEPYQPTEEEQVTIDFVESEMAGRSGQQR